MYAVLIRDSSLQLGYLTRDLEILTDCPVSYALCWYETPLAAANAIAKYSKLDAPYAKSRASRALIVCTTVRTA